MSNKLRMKLSNISASDFEFEQSGILLLTVPQAIANVEPFTSRRLRISRNKAQLRKVLGIDQTKQRIDAIAVGQAQQLQAQIGLLRNVSDKIETFSNNSLYPVFVHNINGLIQSGFSRTQALQKALKIVSVMTREQFENVYGITDPEFFPRLALPSSTTSQLLLTE